MSRFIATGFNSLQVVQKPFFWTLSSGLGSSCFNSLQVVQKLDRINPPMSFSTVSIPYRQSRNQVKGHEEGQAQGTFQFLIGSLETLGYLFLKKIKLLVSIPYRQSRNGNCILARTVLSSLFQFLIGSLETIWFINSHLLVRWFQFLIGSLETDSHILAILWFLLVSIPYRQSRNVKI